MVVTDNGSPGLSATQSFWVTVNQPRKPVLSPVNGSQGGFSFSIAGDSGPDYLVFASTNLLGWLPVWTNSSPTPPFLFTDPGATNFDCRFYRVRLSP